MMLHAARLKDRGLPFSREASIAKLTATDMAMKVTTDAVQVLGGYGYTRDFPVERFMREAKVTQIFEGTNQIQRLVISRSLTQDKSGALHTDPTTTEGATMTTTTPDLAGFTAEDLPDLTGTRAVVTGANSGIGVHTARALAEHGAEVVLACRNVDSGGTVATEISGATVVEELDLASQASVRAFAERFDGPLDVLINNAGVMTPPKYRETEDGFELQLGTNHLGHFALTGLLLPALLQSATPRVVAVASVAHHRGDESVLEGNPESSYKPQQGLRQQQAGQPALRLRAAAPGRGRREQARGERRAPRRLGDEPGRLPGRHGRQPGGAPAGAVRPADHPPVVATPGHVRRCGRRRTAHPGPTSARSG